VDDAALAQSIRPSIHFAVLYANIEPIATIATITAETISISFGICIVFSVRTYAQRGSGVAFAFVAGTEKSHTE
jgi:hypothetical protein